MRIIAGEYRGRTLSSPKGDTTRPTSDRVREALMSSLVSLRGGFEGAVVLDAFAGSGALGLETVSRGAKNVSFYEREARTFQVLRSNVNSLDLAQERFSLHRSDVLVHLPQKVVQPFDIVLLDPPYALEPRVIFDFLEKLFEKGFLAHEVIISYEHAKKSDFSFEKECDSLQWKLLSHKCYGDTSLEFLTCLRGL